MKVALLNDGTTAKVLREDTTPEGVTLQIQKENGAKQVINKDDVIRIVEIAFTLKDLFTGIWKIIKNAFKKSE